MGLRSEYKTDTRIIFKNSPIFSKSKRRVRDETDSEASKKEEEDEITK